MSFTTNPVTGRRIRVGGKTHRTMNKTDRVLAIFEHVTKVRSGYATALIEAKDPGFAKYLASILTDDEIKRWEQNPIDEEIVDDVSRAGFEFYNYMYIGNDGYEYVESALNQQ
jgi:hypothetical protein